MKVYITVLDDCGIHAVDMVFFNKTQAIEYLISEDVECPEDYIVEREIFQ